MKKQKTSRRFGINQFEFSRLHPYSASDIVAWNRLLQSSQTYFLRSGGAPARNDAAQKFFADIPKGKTEKDKYVFALFDGPSIVGVADIVRGYPSPDIASIRFFMIAESHQGTGLGRDLYAQIAELAASWGCSQIELGVCTTNVSGFKFWQRLGFKAVRREPLPGFTGDAIVMRQKIPIAFRSQPIPHQQSWMQQAA